MCHVISQSTVLFLHDQIASPQCYRGSRNPIKQKKKYLYQLRIKNLLYSPGYQIFSYSCFWHHNETHMQPGSPMNASHPGNGHLSFQQPLHRLCCLHTVQLKKKLCIFSCIGYSYLYILLVEVQRTYPHLIEPVVDQNRGFVDTNSNRVLELKVFHFL